MPNATNLRHALSTNEAREIGRKGGIASGISRKRKRIFCKILQEIGDMPNAKADELATAFPGLSPEDITNQTSLALSLYQKALTGDVKAIQTILYYTSQDRTIDSLSFMTPSLSNPFEV